VRGQRPDVSHESAHDLDRGDVRLANDDNATLCRAGLYATPVHVTVQFVELAFDVMLPSGAQMYLDL